MEFIGIIVASVFCVILLLNGFLKSPYEALTGGVYIHFDGVDAANIVARYEQKFQKCTDGHTPHVCITDI